MQERRALANPALIIALLVLQLVPLLLFPAESFSPDTQEWWLPVLLAIMVVIADVNLIGRRSPAPWPWYLLSFAQGFNIISRLMLVWPHCHDHGQQGHACERALHHALRYLGGALRFLALVYRAARRAHGAAQELSAISIILNKKGGSGKLQLAATPFFVVPNY